MSIVVDNTSIKIQNAAGQIKFTSDDKLVYLKAQQIGTINFYGSAINYKYPFSNSVSNAFTYISIKFNSCTGNALAAELIGKWIPANGSIITNIKAYGAGASGQPGVETSVLGLAVSSNNTLVFMQYASRFDNSTPGAGSSYGVGTTAISGSFTYDARVYSYL
jgi:hypothetical protein